VTWNPSYTSSNNQYSSGSGATYDADGHLTYDTFYYYTWNPFGQMATLYSSSGGPTCGSTGVCLTYDAFGQVAEKTYQTGYYQFVLSPIGRIGMTNSLSSMIYTSLPLPGGSTAFTNGSGGIAHAYQHQDWLGTTRLQSSIENRTVGYDVAFTPYGYLYDPFGSINGQMTEFAGMDQMDLNLQNIFDTPNRFIMGEQGRWLSPDPAHASWNAYAYPTNPNNITDPSGLCGDVGEPDCPDGSGNPETDPADAGIGNGLCPSGSVTCVYSWTTYGLPGANNPAQGLGGVFASGAGTTTSDVGGQITPNGNGTGISGVTITPGWGDTAYYGSGNTAGQLEAAVLGAIGSAITAIQVLDGGLTPTAAPPLTPRTGAPIVGAPAGTSIFYATYDPLLRPEGTFTTGPIPIETASGPGVFGTANIPVRSACLPGTAPACGTGNNIDALLQGDATKEGLIQAQLDTFKTWKGGYVLTESYTVDAGMHVHCNKMSEKVAIVPAVAGPCQ
jgi:RHS repeat-associated protein